MHSLELPSSQVHLTLAEYLKVREVNIFTQSLAGRKTNCLDFLASYYAGNFSAIIFIVLKHLIVEKRKIFLNTNRIFYPIVSLDFV